MKFYVYVLHSPTFDKIYVGYSSNWQTRFESHNTLATSGWTIRYRPRVIVHVETFDEKGDAKARKKQLKSFQVRQWIRTTLLKR